MLTGFVSSLSTSGVSERTSQESLGITAVTGSERTVKCGASQERNPGTDDLF